jgi:glycolate oxidase iron-sulfur subunit
MASAASSLNKPSEHPSAGQTDTSIEARPARDVVDYDLLFDCVHCGLCLESCPTYIVTRAEMDSPRGRIYLMKGLAEGKLELDADAVRHLDLCLGCRGCETACPSGVHYGRLIERAREYVEKNYRRDWRVRLRNHLIAAVFPYPERLRRILLPLKAADLLGLRPLLQRFAPSPIRRWLDLVPQLKAQVTQVPEVSGNPPADAPLVTVHHGCVAQVLTDQENLHLEHLLAAAGYRVVRMSGAACCGALDLHHGNFARARDFAQKNVAAFASCGANAIVSAASGCSAVLSSYGSLLKNDASHSQGAQQLAASVADTSSLLLQRKLNFTQEFRALVTYHDACHLVHGMGVREEPRRLLRSIPGVRLIEMEESDVCCGSAGSYNLMQPTMARALVRRKVNHILATGADYVVMSNPGCEFQIAAELRRRGSKVQVIHLADFLVLALKGASAGERLPLRSGSPHV